MDILSLSSLGTAFSRVKLAGIKTKYADKRQREREQELTAQQRERQSVIEKMQEQAEQDRKAAKISSIEAKYKSGGLLTAEEISYFQKESPGYYEELVKQRAEKESYEKALKGCKTKEDVSELHMVKLSQFITETNAICNNPVIPKDKKLELMLKLEKRVEDVTQAQTEFVSSEEYAQLPSVYDEEEPKPEEEKVEKPEDEKPDPSVSDAQPSEAEKTEKSGEEAATSGDKPDGSTQAVKPESSPKAASPDSADKQPQKAEYAHSEKRPIAKKRAAKPNVSTGEVQQIISFEIEKLRGFKSKNVDVVV